MAQVDQLAVLIRPAFPCCTIMSFDDLFFFSGPIELNMSILDVIFTIDPCKVEGIKGTIKYLFPF